MAHCWVYRYPLSSSGRELPRGIVPGEALLGAILKLAPTVMQSWYHTELRNRSFHSTSQHTTSPASVSCTCCSSAPSPLPQRGVSFALLWCGLNRACLYLRWMHWSLTTCTSLCLTHATPFQALPASKTVTHFCCWWAVHWVQRLCSFTVLHSECPAMPGFQLGMGQYRVTDCTVTGTACLCSWIWWQPDALELCILPVFVPIHIL